MQVTYKSQSYAPDLICARYVRHWYGATYRFCEVGSDRRFDLRQGTVDAAELPLDVRNAADARRGFTPAYVPWPA